MNIMTNNYISRKDNMKRKKEQASILIEFIFVMPLLFVVTLWAVELVNQLQYFNKALTLSQYTAQYFFRECSTFRDLYMTDCAERILFEMNGFAKKISAGSRVEVLIKYFNEEDEKYHDYYVRVPGRGGIYCGAGINCGVCGNMISCDGQETVRCRNIDGIDVSNIQRLSFLADAIIIAQSYIDYHPIISSIPLLGLGGGGQFTSNARFICDQTII